MEKEELMALTEVYKTYSEAKERFVDRNFATNRFYLIMCFVFLFATFVVYTLVPELIYTVLISAFGILLSTLWWINLDSYQFLIKIKYAKVLEVMEENLPAQPNKNEYQIANEERRRKKLIVFADLQKYFAALIIVVFWWAFFYSIAQKVYPKNPFANNAAPQTIQFNE